MGFTEILLIGVGLSMDAFAAAVCKGLAMKKINYIYTFIIALFFGGFQALMPLLGWALGRQFEQYIVRVDHWIAFGLLLIIGGKMIFDAARGMKKDEDKKNDSPADEKLNVKEVFILAVATSIDALAVGVSFAFLDVKIVPAISVIGATTFLLSSAGVLVGNKFGAKYQNKAAVTGGAILILIGTKILLEHLGVINF